MENKKNEKTQKSKTQNIESEKIKENKKTSASNSSEEEEKNSSSSSKEREKNKNSETKKKKRRRTNEIKYSENDSPIPSKKISSKKKNAEINALEKYIYHHQGELKLIEYIPIEKKEKSFGNGRYSLRNRIPILNKMAGERIVYKRGPEGESCSIIYSSRQYMRSLWENFYSKYDNNIKMKKKKN